MSETTSIAVVSAGVVSAVGLTWPSTCAAVRAGLDGFRETAFVDQVGQALLGARVADESLGLSAVGEDSVHGGVTRLATIAVRAAREAALGAGGLVASRCVFLLLAGGTERAGYAADELKDCYAACEQALGHRFHAASAILPWGVAGLAGALERAKASLALPDVDHVLLLGLDSLLEVTDVQRHLSQARLLSSQQSDGFISGEAGAALVLRRWRADEAANGAQPVLVLRGSGESHEPASFESGEPNHGKGLAQALRAALGEAGLHAHEMHHRLDTSAGESFFMDESSYAWSRVLREREPRGYTEPLLGAHVGLCGAAQGPLAVALALDMIRKGWAAGGNFLFQAADARERRCAVVLQGV
nr:hypothetical protein [uncultured Roseateles sp.]